MMMKAALINIFSIMHAYHSSLATQDFLSFLKHSGISLTQVFELFCDNLDQGVFIDVRVCVWMHAYSMAKYTTYYGSE